MEKEDQIYDQMKLCYQHYYQFWRDDMLFTWRWWLGIGILVIPWILWIPFRQKHNKSSLFLAGFFCMTVSILLDLIGVQLDFWRYYNKVTPLVVDLPWDLTTFPVAVMFILQIKPNFSPILKGVIVSMFASFVAEPLFNALEMFDYLHWKYVYSFPIYFLLFMAAHGLYKNSLEEKARRT